MKDHFEKILGLGNASDNENDLAAYSYDASELQGKARLVLFPSQDEQLRLILSYCNRNNLDVLLRGNGTNSTGMAVPQNSIVVSMQAFDRIHALNVNEGWVKVDVGVTIAELNDALREHGFRYALEPGSKKMTTIGGWLAVNGLSKQSQLYGRAADTVIDLEIMDGTGKLFSVNKDLQDFIGNEGSIFAIIRAKLKIIPITERSADIQYFDIVQDAINYCHEIVQQKPLAIEFLDSVSATYAGFNTKHTVIVEWEGDRGEIKYEQYAALMHKKDGVRKLLGQQGYVLIEDSLLDNDKITEAIEWCRQKELPVTAHAGLGVVRPFLKREQEVLRDQWCAFLEQHNQKSVGQFGYGLRKKKYVPISIKNKVRKLKERYDYNNILGRGKLYDYV